MWLNPQFSADLVTFTENPLMENFIFCAVFIKKRLQHKYFFINIVKFLRTAFL